MTENEVLDLDKLIEDAKVLAKEKDKLAKTLRNFKDYGNSKSTITRGAEKVQKEAEQYENISKLFEELNAYRAIGTVEELKTMKENGAFTGVELAQLAAMQMRLKEYSSIGTIEEFKALKEFIEKLNKRLKEKLLEYINKANDEMIENGHTLDFENCLGHKEAYENVLYEIVNELAEEMRGAE